MGGGAQVAMSTVNEADRHNISGYRISVDTIQLVGEENLASAGPGRLPICPAACIDSGDCRIYHERRDNSGYPCSTVRGYSCYLSEDGGKYLIRRRHCGNGSYSGRRDDSDA